MARTKRPPIHSPQSSRSLTALCVTAYAPLTPLASTLAIEGASTNTQIATNWATHDHALAPLEAEAWKTQLQFAHGIIKSALDQRDQHTVSESEYFSALDIANIETGVEYLEEHGEKVSPREKREIQKESLIE
ncbi:hypothetical protein K458DRAFT_61496 [Lentithecium fluviatile CBS 122367]|uniref:Uncharacterized protein n=1 Tax=Lentithecium fluviatile CBS 122367 TaxID=1168545 RepID=A0A6G1JKA8_9PLEO|nr:hypothetical protein K458DRAFT_61496 [Lentithecium fluviatile CBS 122367]